MNEKENLLQKGQNYLSQGNAAEALNTYKSIMTKYPTDGLGYFGYAVAMRLSTVFSIEELTELVNTAAKYPIEESECEYAKFLANFICNNMQNATLMYNFCMRDYLNVEAVAYMVNAGADIKVTSGGLKQICLHPAYNDARKTEQAVNIVKILLSGGADIYVARPDGLPNITKQYNPEVYDVIKRFMDGDISVIKEKFVAANPYKTQQTFNQQATNQSAATQQSGNKKFIKYIIIGIVILILWIIGSSADDTVTYYRDYNGNGKCDWGEAVWSEDSSGKTTFYD